MFLSTLRDENFSNSVFFHIRNYSPHEEYLNKLSFTLFLRVFFFPLSLRVLRKTRKIPNYSYFRIPYLPLHRRKGKEEEKKRNERNMEVF